MGKKVKQHPSLDRIQEALSYNRDTGTFVWKIKTWGHQRIGDRAGRKLQGKYWAVGLDECTLQVSRLVWLFETGEWPKARIMFKDGNPDNTRFDNLELSKSLLGYGIDRAAAQRTHRSENPDHYRAQEMKRRFGITLSDYETKLVAQNGLCACCGKPETAVWAKSGQTKRLAVDHNHATGEVRDLLCSLCNPMIGYAQEDVERLRAAIRYLEKHSKAEKIIPMRLVKEQN